MSKDEKGEKKRGFSDEELRIIEQERMRISELLELKILNIGKRIEEKSKKIKSELDEESIKTEEDAKRKKKRKKFMLLNLVFAIIAIIINVYLLEISPEQLNQFQVYLTWAFLLSLSLMIAAFFSMVILRPLGEFGVFQLIKDNNLKEFVKVSRNEIQVLAFSYFIAIVLLVPAIGFARTTLLEESVIIEILDIGIAAFVVFAGRAVFSYKPLVGKSFYAFLSFVVIVLYINLLIHHTFPSVDYLLLLPTTTTTSIALASAGEKLLKINRVRMKID